MSTLGLRRMPSVYLVILLLIGLALVPWPGYNQQQPVVVSCKPTTQPMELAQNQLGFSTQNDQMKYLDVDDYVFRSLNITQVWGLAQKSNRTAYNYTLQPMVQLLDVNKTLRLTGSDLAKTSH